MIEEDDESKKMERWFADDDVRKDPSISKEILEFIKSNGVPSVVMTDRIIGCPHEEGIDCPEVRNVLQFPFWAHRDRWSGDVLQ